MQDYLHILKAFAEGEMDLTQWRDWWAENASTIEPRVSRKCFLRLKHQPFRQARRLLDEFGIDYQPDESKCQRCGETLFKAVPGETTQDDIVMFAHRMTSPDAETIAKDRWIHPGEYCPNGCTIILINYGYGDLWEKLDKEFEKSHICSLTITGNATLPRPLNQYSVYIDGNIAKTRQQDTQPPNGEFVRLLPGDHRIVVRESEVKRVGRLESNTLWFTASVDVPLNFEVGIIEGHLNLIER